VDVERRPIRAAQRGQRRARSSAETGGGDTARAAEPAAAPASSAWWRKRRGQSLPSWLIRNHSDDHRESRE
jgi:hypothetical protein